MCASRSTSGAAALQRGAPQDVGLPHGACECQRKERRANVDDLSNRVPTPRVWLIGYRDMLEDKLDEMGDESRAYYEHSWGDPYTPEAFARLRNRIAEIDHLLKRYK